MTQKEEERFILYYFRKYYEAFPKGKITQGESPDFIIRNGPHQSTGIELTRLVTEKPTLYDNILISVEKKNRKLKIYNDIGINSIWLIIYTDDLASLNGGHVHNNLSKWTFNSGFSTVYLFDLFERKIYNLMLT